MLADEWLVRLRQGSDILIEPRASLGFSLLMSLYALATQAPPLSGSRSPSNPIRVGRWRQVSGLFNSPPNDIRASWSALMITHSANLGLHQHTPHKGTSRAKCAHVCVRVCVFDWPSFCNQGLFECYTTLKDFVICCSLGSIVTPIVLFWPKTHCSDYYVCAERKFSSGPESESAFRKIGARLNPGLLRKIK